MLKCGLVLTAALSLSLNSRVLKVFANQGPGHTIGRPFPSNSHAEITMQTGKFKPSPNPCRLFSLDYCCNLAWSTHVANSVAQAKADPAAWFTATRMQRASIPPLVTYENDIDVLSMTWYFESRNIQAIDTPRHAFFEFECWFISPIGSSEWAIILGQDTFSPRSRVYHALCDIDMKERAVILPANVVAPARNENKSDPGPHDNHQVDERQTGRCESRKSGRTRHRMADSAIKLDNDRTNANSGEHLTAVNSRRAKRHKVDDDTHLPKIQLKLDAHASQCLELPRAGQLVFTELVASTVAYETLITNIAADSCICGSTSHHETIAQAEDTATACSSRRSTVCVSSDVSSPVQAQHLHLTLKGNPGTQHSVNVQLEPLSSVFEHEASLIDWDALPPPTKATICVETTDFPHDSVLELRTRESSRID